MKKFIEQDKLPPHAIEAEQGVLGCILLSPTDCLSEVISKNKAGHEIFYDLRHQTLYSILGKMFEHNMPIDTVTLNHVLRRKKQLQEVGGLGYIATLPDKVPSAANLEYYLDIVLEKYLLRKMVQTCAGIIHRVDTLQGEVKPFLASCEKEVLSIQQSIETSKGIANLMEIHGEVIADYEAAMTAGEHIGLKTGLRDLDMSIGGIIGQELILLAGAQSSGKTSLMMDIFCNLAKSGNMCGVISLETTAKKLVHRILCSLGGVNGQHLMMGCPNLGDHERIKASAVQLASFKDLLLIDDSTGVTIGQVQAKIRKMVQMGAKIIGIDYIQKIKANGDSSTERMVMVSEGIQSIGKELNVPIIAISMLTKEGTKGDRKPRLDDLFNSAQFQFDATQGWLLSIKKEGKKDDLVEVNLEIGKQKEGACNDITLDFYKPAFHFENHCPIEKEDAPKEKPKAKRVTPDD
jgi:replicative DNA helicase